jgi:hypothetical protein
MQLSLLFFSFDFYFFPFMIFLYIFLLMGFMSGSISQFRHSHSRRGENDTNILLDTRDRAAPAIMEEIKPNNDKRKRFYMKISLSL